MAIKSPRTVPWKQFSEAEHVTWSQLFSRLDECRKKMAVPEFLEGVKRLGFTSDRVPDVHEVNRKLKSLTGWQAVPVEGLEEAESFYPMMANRCYPIGWFLRDPKDLNYTPAPDVFHDLYGHMPFFANEAYANFCADFGRRVSKYLDRPDYVRQFERLFWFTAEFGLLETPQGRRIFGGGILSSFGESYYSLSDKPKVVPFDLQTIRNKEYRIDTFQETMFLLPSRETLFGCLDEFEQLVIHS